MWVREILLGIIGLSSGMIVAGGLFSFIASLGVISDFADRTHTGSKVLLYGDAAVVGGILGNVASIYQPRLLLGSWFLVVFGIFSGIFVGCWSIALAEILNVFPIFIRKAKILHYVPYVILMLAVGKGIGAFIFCYLGW